MAEVATREPIDGGDSGVWGQYELAHNRLSQGLNTRDLFLDGATLKLRKGKLGLYDGTTRWVILNTADATIAIAGLTVSCWARVELSVVAGVVVTEITSIAGQTNPSVVPSTFTGAYDGTKGGYYISATKRCVGLVFINSAGAVATIVNGVPSVREHKKNYDSPFPRFVAMPWMKNLAARAQVATFSGSCNTDLSMALKDTTKDFTAVAVGDIVQNTTSKEFATVLYKISTTTLMLDADIFPAGNEAYAVYAQPVLASQDGMAGFIELTGALLDGDGVKVADTNTVYHLIDGDGTSWAGLVAVGDWAMNLATGLVAQVTVVAAHDLTLQWDAFPNGNEKYMIFAGYVTIADAESPLNGVVIPEMNIGGRYFGGGKTAGRKEDDSGLAHQHATYYGTGAYSAGSGVTSDGNSPGGVDTATGHNVRQPIADDTNGGPRFGDHTQPRTIRSTMVLRIK